MYHVLLCLCCKIVQRMKRFHNYYPIKSYNVNFWWDIVFKCEGKSNALIILDSSINIYEHEQVNPKAKIHFVYDQRPISSSSLMLNNRGLCSLTLWNNFYVFLHPNGFLFHKSALNQKMGPYPHKIAQSAVTLFKKLALPRWTGGIAGWIQGWVFALLCVTWESLSCLQSQTDWAKVIEAKCSLCPKHFIRFTGMQKVEKNSK